MEVFQVFVVNLNKLVSAFAVNFDLKVKRKTGRKNQGSAHFNVFQKCRNAGIENPLMI